MHRVVRIVLDNPQVVRARDCVHPAHRVGSGVHRRGVLTRGDGEQGLWPPAPCAQRHGGGIEGIGRHSLRTHWHRGELYAARDPIGVNSLYWGTGLDGSKWFASEAKPLVRGGCVNIEMFPPGHYYSSRDDKLVRYYNPKWYDVQAAQAPIDLPALRCAPVGEH